jgi:hypothetical protein
MRRLDKSELAEGEADCAEVYASANTKEIQDGIFGPNFHEVLKRVQERLPHVMEVSVKVEADHSVRRFFTT